MQYSSSFKCNKYEFFIKNLKTVAMKTSRLSGRVNVGTFGQCRYNQTLLYFLDDFSATSVVIAMCNPVKSQ